MESETEIRAKQIAKLKERVIQVEQRFLDELDLANRAPEQWRVSIGNLRKTLEATDARFREEMNALESSLASLNASIEESIDRRQMFVTGAFYRQQVRPLQAAIESLHENLRAVENTFAEIKKIKA
jgi:hypothetical protein